MSQDKIIHYTGEVVTCLAVVPLSLFGALLVDHMIASEYPHANKIFRTAIDLVVFLTAEEAKRRLVRFFNKNDFKNFFDRQNVSRVITNTIRNYDLTAVMIVLMSINISLLFSVLTIKSFGDASALLRDSNSKFAHTTAQILSSKFFQAPFIFSAFLANFIGYPGIHYLALSYLLKTFNAVTDNAQQYQTRLEYEYRILNFRSKLMQRYALENEEQHDQGLLEREETLWPHDLEALTQSTDRDLVIYCLQNSPADDSNFAARIKQERQIKLSIILVSLFICITGNINFIQMGTIVSQILGWSKTAGSMMGGAAFISIAMLSLVTSIQLAELLMHDVTEKEYILFHLHKRRVLLLAFLICLCSGTPNSYQAFLAQESLFLLIIAAFASCLIELSGFYRLTITKKEEDLLTAHPEQKSPLTMSYRLRELSHLLIYKKSELTEISTQITPSPDYKVQQL